MAKGRVHRPACIGPLVLSLQTTLCVLHAVEQRATAVNISVMLVVTLIKNDNLPACLPVYPPPPPSLPSLLYAQPGGSVRLDVPQEWTSFAYVYDGERGGGRRERGGLCALLEPCCQR